MARGLLDRPSPHQDTSVTSPIPLRLLDRALDRELTRSCALVGRASGAGTQVILSTDAGMHPMPLFWVSCNARAAELCDKYGVELLLVEEDGRVRIRIDRYQASDRVSIARSRWLGWWRWRWPGRDR